MERPLWTKKRLLDNAEMYGSYSSYVVGSG